MLVLNRKADESIVIERDIKIKIVRIGRGQVTIGIDAPSTVGIYRQELLDSILKNNIRRREAILTR